MDKVKAGTASEKALFSLGWKVDELGRLYERGRTILVTINYIIEVLNVSNQRASELNLPQKISQLKKSLSSLLKGVFHAHIGKNII